MCGKEIYHGGIGTVIQNVIIDLKIKTEFGEV